MKGSNHKADLTLQLLWPWCKFGHHCTTHMSKHKDMCLNSKGHTHLLYPTLVHR